MPLLIEMEINGTTNYLSQEGVALDHYWDSKIVNFDSPQKALAQKWGGYLRPNFGSISYFPDLFINNWPPPTKCLTIAKYTDTTETSATTLFTAMGHLLTINRNEVTYGLHGESYSATIAANVNVTGSLATNFITSAASLGLGFDRTLARNDTSTNIVLLKTSGEQLLIDFLSDIAAYHTHMYYIEDNTIYLVDMFQDNGTTTMTEFDYFPISYEFNQPVSAVNGGATVYTGVTYPYGSEISQTPYQVANSEVTTALKKIYEIVEKPFINLSIPLKEPLRITPRMRINLTDSSQIVDTSAYLRVGTTIYDFNREEVTITGEGEIESA